MYLIRYSTSRFPAPQVGVLDDDRLGPLPFPDMAAVLRLPLDELRHAVGRVEFADRPDDLNLLPPIDGRTEVWASGVTYLRSREARIEESTQQSVYELIYEADRPELFFKAPAWRVVTDQQPIAVRSDSAINVPEPELAVVANSAGVVIGYLISNDMSSRTLEGENPLYLPQAKVYAGACALSAGIRPVWDLDVSDLRIAVMITRDTVVVFEGSTSSANICRDLTGLVTFLYHSENFPDGSVLSTGTGIVPDVDFTLLPGDVVEIGIDGLGQLTNPVVVGKQNFRWLSDLQTSGERK